MLYLTEILPAMGYAFLHSFWQMGLLLATYFVITKLVQGNAALRYRIASLLSFTGVILFIITFFAGLHQPHYLVLAESEGILPTNWYHYMMLSAGAFYVVLLSWRFAQFFTQFKNLQQLHELPFTKVPVHFRIFVAKHAAYFGINSNIQLRLQEVISPATFGFIKPIILFPASCLTQLSTTQIEALLLHELAHIKRNDFIWSMFLQLADSILCINPFMQQLVQQARQESEHACDDYVLQFGYQPDEYAKALLIIAKNQTAPAWALGAKGQNGGEQLLYRINRMLTGGNLSPIKSFRKTTLSIFLLAAGLAGLLIPVSENNRPVNNGFEPVEFTRNILNFPLTKSASTSWESTVLETRKIIFASAIGKKPTEAEIKNLHELKKNQQDDNKGIIKPEIVESNFVANSEVAPSLQQDENKQKTFEAIHSDPVILSAGLVNNLHENEVSRDEAVVKGLQQISVLLEKLETEKTLADSELQKLIALINLHTTLKKELYQQAYLQQNPEIAAFNAYEVKEDETGVLVIVYDEATSVLGIRVMQPDELPEHIQLDENIASNEQQVIFLKRNQVRKGKVIKL